MVMTGIEDSQHEGHMVKVPGGAAGAVSHVASCICIAHDPLSSYPHLSHGQRGRMRETMKKKMEWSGSGKNRRICLAVWDIAPAWEPGSTEVETLGRAGHLAVVKEVLRKTLSACARWPEAPGPTGSLAMSQIGLASPRSESEHC